MRLRWRRGHNVWVQGCVILALACFVLRLRAGVFDVVLSLELCLRERNLDSHAHQKIGSGGNHSTYASTCPLALVASVNWHPLEVLSSF